MAHKWSGQTIVLSKNENDLISLGSNQTKTSWHYINIYKDKPHRKYANQQISNHAKLA